MLLHSCSVFFFNDTATTEIYTLSLHDALPICDTNAHRARASGSTATTSAVGSLNQAWVPLLLGPSSSGTDRIRAHLSRSPQRSEEHTSELQSRQYLVCRPLLEKKKHTTVPKTI